MSDYICHYGVKGMRWGVRRYNQPNANYSEKQRKQDRAIYGKGSERRINKRMNKGSGIKAARHYEAERKARIDTAKGIGKTVTKTALATAGSIAVMHALKKYGKLSDFENGTITEAVISVGKKVINQAFR